MRLSVVLSLAVLLVLVGACASGPGPSPSKPVAPAPADGAALPPGANTICPVSGDPVDPSEYVDYQGRRVYFCCGSCPARFNADPAKYFAKAYPPSK